jgi:ubiquinone/menaquinone biosynthesis C-methylase UbiE
MMNLFLVISLFYVAASLNVPAALSFTSNAPKLAHKIQSSLELRLLPESEYENGPTSPSCDGALSRRAVLSSTWKIPVAAAGAYFYGKYIVRALPTLPIGNRVPTYPMDHELHVQATIQTAFSAALNARSVPSTLPTRPFRVLEVGMGTEARVLRRGLYDAAFEQVRSSNRDIQRMELVGLDLHVPTNEKVLNDITQKVEKLRSTAGTDIDWKMVQSSITDKTPFSDEYFDVIFCCLTLCSVNDPAKAISEMQRLLRSDCGTLGYVEHVAVDPNDQQHQFLSHQQQVLDPLQQLVVDNCHLHRNTEQTLDTVLEWSHKPYRTLARERYYVDDMWPVSCQASGVIQLVGSRKR